MSGILNDLKEDFKEEVIEVVEIVKDKLDYNDDGKVDLNDFFAQLKDYIDIDKDGKVEITEILIFAKGAYSAIKKL